MDSKNACEPLLVDYRSRHFVSYLVLHAALKEAMGGSYPQSEELRIRNAVWRMVVENDIPFSIAKSFADEHMASSRKRVFGNKLVLDSWWNAMQYNLKNGRHRKEPTR